MSGRVVVTGLAELQRALTNAPDDIRAEGMAIVRETTESAASEIAHSYPSRTGTLKQRVATVYPSSGVLAGVVQSRAPHSHLFEFGTRDRRTKQGWNRGVMPAAQPGVTVPIATKWRARMFEKLKDMLREKGWTINDD